MKIYDGTRQKKNIMSKKEILKEKDANMNGGRKTTRREKEALLKEKPSEDF